MGSEKIEFQAGDDAWYSVEITFDKELRIKFEDTTDLPMRFSPAKFESVSDLMIFQKRFRSVSVLLEDHECQKVEEGMRLCCSYQVGEDVRYYDAIVKRVSRSNHVIDDCKCVFYVQWQDGPDSASPLEHPTEMGKICWLTKKDIDHPALEAFFKRANALLNKEPDGQRNLEKGSPINMGKVSVLPRRIGLDDFARGNIQRKSTITFDRDNFLLVENLESGLSPENVVNFIYHRTSVICRVYVAPIFLSETSVKGAVFVEKPEDLKKIDAFLHSPAHLITSIGGRPWVISRDWLVASPCLKRYLTKPKVMENNAVFDRVSKKLKVVRKGTEEHKTAERLVKLYTAYRDHLDGLAKTLVKEENKIMT